MIGLDNGYHDRKREAEAPTCLKIGKTITAKTVASPYFSVKDFAFAPALA